MANLINNNDFCSSLLHEQNGLDPICKRLDGRESLFATISTSYVSLLYVRVHLCQAEWLNNIDRAKIEVYLKIQAEIILCNVYHFAYVCDPLFKDRHTKTTSVFGTKFVHFDDRFIVGHCYSALL